MKMKKARLEKKREELIHVTRITSLEKLEEVLESTEGRTEKQRETPRITVIKQQLQLRLPCKRVVLSVKGKKKTSRELQRELELLITEEQQQLQAKLVQGAHQLQDDAASTATMIYEGEIVDVSETDITIKYTGYENLFTWTVQELVEDFQHGDLKYSGKL